MTGRPYIDKDIVNHQSYVVPNLTDGTVMASQAERRRDRDGETTIVHAHPYEIQPREGPWVALSESKQECNLDCRIFQPGFKTRSIYAIPEPIEEST